MESIEAINKRLIDLFGLYENQPAWRIVWSESQMEKRFGTYEDRTPEGLFIREVTEVREIPKYRQYIHNKWILERLLPNLAFGENGASVDKLTYEPIWVFQNTKGEAVPVKFEACELLIKQVIENMTNKSPYAKYAESNEEQLVNELKEDERIFDALFGEESAIADSLHYGKGVFLDSTKVKV